VCCRGEEKKEWVECVKVCGSRERRISGCVVGGGGYGGCGGCGGGGGGDVCVCVTCVCVCDVCVCVCVFCVCL
jgi:hypothetical protein